MKTKLSTLVLIACLGSSLAFAGNKDKSKHAEDANATAQPAAAATAKQDDTSGSANKANKKKNAKPAPTQQEQQFDEVLRGIYG